MTRTPEEIATIIGCSPKATITRQRKEHGARLIRAYGDERARDEHEEVLGLREMVRGYTLTAEQAQKDLTSLRAQRDELLAALEEYRKDEWRCTVDWGPREPREAILERVDLAIAKAKARP